VVQDHPEAVIVAAATAVAPGLRGAVTAADHQVAAAIAVVQGPQEVVQAAIGGNNLKLNHLEFKSTQLKANIIFKSNS